MSGWISVEESLPEGDKVVWTYSKEKGVVIGLCDGHFGGELVWYDSAYGSLKDFFSDVTHWMPLEVPQAPENLMDRKR